MHIPRGNTHACLSISTSREKTTAIDDIKTVQMSLFSLVKDFFCRSFSGEEMQSLLSYMAGAQDEQQVRHRATLVSKDLSVPWAGLMLGSRWGEATEVPVGYMEGSGQPAPCPAGLRGAGGDPQLAEGLACPGAALCLPL